MCNLLLNIHFTTGGMTGGAQEALNFWFDDHSIDGFQ